MRTPKQTVEGTPFISIDDIKDLETDRTYKLKWHDGSSIQLDKYEDHAILRYALGEKRIKTYVELDKTKVGYGFRTWFKCPLCGKRTAKLYIVSGKFACGNCHELTYTTSKYSGNRLNYLSLKIRRLQLRLGLDINTCDIQETPLFKPKHMHQQTFWVLKTELEIMQLHYMNEWLQVVSR